MKHTKGNWKVVSQMPNGYTIESETGKIICFSQCDDEDGEHSDEDMANLDLIKAAPQLLEFLKFIINEIETTPNELNDALLGLIKFKSNKLISQITK
jgi:hypothetical protein